MLLVKTRLDKSRLHGVGLFADQPIAKGTVIWQYDDRVDRRLQATDIASLPEPPRLQLQKYTYRERLTNEYVLCGDDARFLNHSREPNCLDVHDEFSSGLTIAARDIDPGEELTCDYRLFDQDLRDGKYKL